jgi:hypothetical protein
MTNKDIENGVNTANVVGYLDKAKHETPRDSMTSSIVRASVDYAGAIVYSDGDQKSTAWYLLNGIGYLCGGFLFVAGSIFYYPEYQTAKIDGFTIGAYLYLIGASLFLLVGIQDWLIVKDGCIKPRRYFVEMPGNNPGAVLMDDGANNNKAEVIQRIRTSEVRTVEVSYWKRAEPGINVFLYVLGSVQYVIGCVCYIPILVLPKQGSYLFCVGSVFFFVAALWDIKRLGQANRDAPMDRTFRFKNIFRADLGVALNTAIGAVFFYYGAILFLELLDITDVDVYATKLRFATNVFLTGSITFTLSALFLCYNLRKEICKKNSGS